MERSISIEEKIRRAEEIYNRRQNKDVRVSSTTVNSGEKTTLSLLKKMILQLLICLVIYFIFYLIKNNNYIFSQSVIEKTSEVLKYNVDFNNLYNKAIVLVNNKKQHDTETNAEIENKEDLQKDENNELIPNGDEEKKEATNGIGGGGNAEILAVVSEPLSQKTQMELDAEYVKENYSLILPIQGTVTSRFGKREPTDIISENHQGIDLGAETGTSIKSAMDGEVIISGTDRDYRQLHSNKR